MISSMLLTLIVVIIQYSSVFEEIRNQQPGTDADPCTIFPVARLQGSSLLKSVIIFMCNVIISVVVSVS